MSYTIPRVYIDNFANAMETIIAANKQALEWRVGRAVD